MRAARSRPCENDEKHARPASPPKKIPQEASRKGAGVQSAVPQKEQKDDQCPIQKMARCQPRKIRRFSKKVADETEAEKEIISSPWPSSLPAPLIVQPHDDPCAIVCPLAGASRGVSLTRLPALFGPRR